MAILCMRRLLTSCPYSPAASRSAQAAVAVKFRSGCPTDCYLPDSKQRPRTRSGLTRADAKDLRRDSVVHRSARSTHQLLGFSRMAEISLAGRMSARSRRRSDDLAKASHAEGLPEPYN